MTERGIVEAEVVENAPAGEESLVLKWATPRGAKAHSYRAGEFVQVAAWGNVSRDPLLRRPFSVLDRGVLPDGRPWASLLYQVHGRGTRLFAALRPGDRLSVLGPLGNTFTPPRRPGPALLVAGGVGVAPFVLLARELSASNREVIVLLGARTASRLCLVPELEAAGARVRVATESGDRGAKGYVTALLEEELRARGPGNIGAVYVCGPEPMLRAVHAIARRAEVPGEVSLERRMACGFGVCFTCVCRIADEKTGTVRNKRTCLEGPVVRLEALPLDRW